MTKHKWTKEHDAILRDMYGELPAEYIGRMTGHTKASIYQRAQVLGLCARKPTKDGRYKPAPSKKYIAYVMVGQVKRIMKQSHSRRYFMRWMREHRGMRGLKCQIATIQQAA